MKAAVVWPDVVIAGVVLLLGLRGLKRGFVGEIAGLVAVAVGFAAAMNYSGGWDRWIGETLNLAAAPAHWVATGAFAATGFGITAGLAWMLGQIMSLPIIGIPNSLLGALAGIVKGVLLCWFVMYCALFLPIAPQIRKDLKKSQLASVLIRPDAEIDARIKGNVPEFARDVTSPLFRAHHL